MLELRDHEETESLKQLEEFTADDVYPSFHMLLYAGIGTTGDKHVKGVSCSSISNDSAVKTAQEGNFRQEA